MLPLAPISSLVVCLSVISPCKLKCIDSPYHTPIREAITAGYSNVIPQVFGSIFKKGSLGSSLLIAI